MREAWDNGQTEEVTNIIDHEIPGCSTQPDSNFCKASIWFTGGYLFQTGFEEGDSLAEKFKGIAKSYYSRVLYILPENQNALSNYLHLFEESDSAEYAIQYLLKLANQYPQQRIAYLLRIGDLYTQQNDPKSAGKYFQLAYDEDPWSEPACSRIVSLYKQYDIVPIKPGYQSSSEAINEFIYSCQKVGLANFSEEMARQHILKGLNDPYLTNENLMTNVLIWADILAENNWFDKSRIDDLRENIDIKSVLRKELAVQADAMLVGYSRMAAAEVPDQMGIDESWLSEYPTVTVIDRDPISPRSVCIKILKIKGENAYFREQAINAEQFWQLGFEKAGNENPLTAALGKELAQLYFRNTILDPDGEKMSDLVKELIEGKMFSYNSGNIEMIREYHTVLGSIFYDQGRYSSEGIDNAEFQLSRALSPEFGPIINPEMRTMLANVYGHRGDQVDMIEENTLAIQDMFRLDRIQEVKEMIDDAEQYVVGHPEKYANQLRALNEILILRTTCADPVGSAFENQNEVYQFLIDQQKQEALQKTVLDSTFVKEQYFKALSDKGQNISNDQPVWKQQVYSQALIRIADQSQLGSYDDYNRLQHIRQSLAGSMERPELLSTTRFNKEAKLQYKENSSGEEYKSFVIPTMGQEIQIPQSMFKLNETVTEYYKPTVADTTAKTTMMPRIQYEAKTYRVINHTDTPKENIQEPVYKHIIPQQQVQKNIVNEKQVITHKYYKG
jgi:hypothetical protein